MVAKGGGGVGGVCKMGIWGGENGFEEGLFGTNGLVKGTFMFGVESLRNSIVGLLTLTRIFLLRGQWLWTLGIFTLPVYFCIFFFMIFSLIEKQMVVISILHIILYLSDLLCKSTSLSVDRFKSDFYIYLNKLLLLKKKRVKGVVIWM